MVKTIVLILVIALVAFVVHRIYMGKKYAAEYRQKAIEFLEANKTKDGVQSTASGLQYLVLQEGTGVQPQANSRVEVHYHGTLLDGSVFDSSVDRGQTIEFALNQVIPGWTEGLQLMKQGGKTRLFVPPDLGYGNRSAGSIPPGSLLIFDVELVNVR